MQHYERLHYPLKAAAEILKCDEDYLIHLASEGYAELCVKFGKTLRDVDGMSGSYEFDINKLHALVCRNNLQHDNRIKISYSSLPFTSAFMNVTYELSEDGTKLNDYHVEITGASGLFSLGKNFIYEKETPLIAGSNVLCNRFGFPTNPNDIDDIFTDMEEDMSGLFGEIEISRGITFDKSAVLMTAMELNRLKKKVSRL